MSKLEKKKWVVSLVTRKFFDVVSQEGKDSLKTFIVNAYSQQGALGSVIFENRSPGEAQYLLLYTVELLDEVTEINIDYE